MNCSLLTVHSQGDRYTSLFISLMISLYSLTKIHSLRSGVFIFTVHTQAISSRSRIHFYAPSLDGVVVGIEDVLITPFTCDRTSYGDAVVAAIMRKLTTCPQMYEDLDVCERQLRFAIAAGIISQWTIGAVRGFPTESAAQNLKEEVYVPSMWMYAATNVSYHAFYLLLLYVSFLADFFQEDDLHLQNVYYSEMKDAGFFDADWE